MHSHSFVFIYNPKSGGASDAELAKHIRKSLGKRYVWHETDGPGDAARLAQAAARNFADVVVAAGGDGTVHEVVNGLMTSDACARPALGIVPLGSGNDFAAAAGVPHDSIEALYVALRGQAKHIDVGSIESDDGKSAFWINSCGIGLNARIAIRARTYRKLHGEAKYLTAAISSIWNDHHPLPMQIDVDYGSFHEKTTLLTLANGPCEGGGFLMAPGAEIDDGRFDLLMVGALTRLGLLRLLPSTRKGTHLKSRAISLLRCSTLRVSCEEPLAIHTDGEIFAAPANDVHRITARIHPGALRVIS